tara:strand:+ start:3106 stop:3885 length:780 start_codon:yes stop_codon:yes gene_type:complete
MSLGQASAQTGNISTWTEQSYLVSPTDYIVEIHELGLCKTNPIQGTTNTVRYWNKKDNIILWKKKENQTPLIIDVAPGKQMPGNITLGKIPYDSYNFSYVLLKKSIKLKAKAEFGDTVAEGGPTVIYSGNDAKAAGLASWSQFTEDINNFNFNDKPWDTKDDNTLETGSSSYFDDVTANKVEGLLLKADKKSTSTDASTTGYILAVYTGGVIILPKTDISIKFSSTNGATISRVNTTAWNDPDKLVFNCLPPKYTIVSS